MLLFKTKNHPDLNTKYELFTSDIPGEYECNVNGPLSFRGIDSGDPHLSGRIMGYYP